jgi:hypothetical protein
MKRSIIVAALVSALAMVVLGGAAVAAPSPNSEATITFSLGTGGLHGCTLTITSSKDISNFVVNGVKTELSDGTTVLTLDVSPGDVISVKAGTTVATFTVPADAACGSHDGDGDHTGDH